MVNPNTTEKIFKDGRKHIEAKCPDCEKFIKWLPQWVNPGDFRLPFGKHSGQALKDVDRKYLEWCRENLQEDKIKKIIKEYLAGTVTP